MRIKFCEGCFSCTKPCGKQEKKFSFTKEDTMTKYEKIRVVLGVAQLLTAIVLAIYYKA